MYLTKQSMCYKDTTNKNSPCKWDVNIVASKLIQGTLQQQLNQMIL